jgi:hypothetical protein
VTAGQGPIEALQSGLVESQSTLDAAALASPRTLVRSVGREIDALLSGNTSIGALSGSKTQRRFGEVIKTWQAGGMKSRIASRLVRVVEDKQPAGIWLTSAERVKRRLGNARSR